ncbi:E3 ubiquitin-protein ligase TRIM31-like [Talpa occidentalis]|uniref:E3 ubiquitin-protein ligase TRIM31-like n=1 Tax=Talpa occidentalis TaxID=50954 RepID=UPI0023F774F2|nr:E3 ubiquitin-protein ligase TRIM31-like [Talpa occidentalis]
MASQQFSDRLKEELLCPICIDILQNPVTLDCGHNFCLRCISRVAEETSSKCPLCGKSVRKNYEPNWLLVNLVEKVQAMDPSEMPTEKEKDRCEKHEEKLHYFCDLDGKLLCMLCQETKEHKSHNVLLIEEAVPRYQEKLQLQVEVLKQKEMVIKQAKPQGEQKINNFMAKVELEKQKITEEFQQLYQTLQEEENFLLSRMNWLAQEGDSGKNVYVTASETQLNSLKLQIDSLMERQHFTHKEMLKNIKIILCRSEGFPFLSPTPVPSHLERKLSDAQSRHKNLASYLKKFKDHLKNEGEKDRSKFLKGMSDKDITKFFGVPVSCSSEGTSDSPVPMTFDEVTAHPELIISPDLKTATLDFIQQESSDEPTDPECFYPFRCVLGFPGLSRGRHTWETQLDGPGGGACMVGVALGQAARRGFLVIDPLTGFWVLRITGSECQALLEAGAREDLPACPRKVGICVDFECGEVVFYDAVTNTHIYTFHTSFPGQVFPFYRLLFPGTRITLNP